MTDINGRPEVERLERLWRGLTALELEIDNPFHPAPPDESAAWIDILADLLALKKRAMRRWSELGGRFPNDV